MISFVNNVSELIDELMGGIDENTSNDIAVKKLKNFKNCMLKSINNCNLYIKTDTKNNTEPDTKNKIEPDTKNNTEPDTRNNTKSDTKNNTKPYTKDDIEWDINDTRASMRKNQIKIKNRYKSLLETKETIRNNIYSIYSGLRKLPRESQLKANE